MSTLKEMTNRSILVPSEIEEMRPVVEGSMVEGSTHSAEESVVKESVLVVQ